MEEWKDITGYEGVYQISSLGSIKSLPRRVIRRAEGKEEHTIPILGKIKAKKFSKTGYVQVNLYLNGNPHYVYVHRLVALHFIPNPNGFKEVNHIDGDKSNNNVKNLEWCTRQRNCKHAHDTGLRPRYWGRQDHLNTSKKKS